MSRLSLVLGLIAVSAVLRADDVIHRFEGDAVPYQSSLGWIVADACDGSCVESLAEGSFRLFWSKPSADGFANFHHWIAQPQTPPPPTLWVEWRFRSNHLIPRNSFRTDGRFATDFGRIHEVTYLYANAAVSASGNDFVLELSPDEFHSYRFESLDGLHFKLSVDGEVFKNGIGNIEDNGYHYVQFSGNGGDKLDYVLDTLNEWDFIRYGTIGYGESIVAVDPPGPATGGFLDARVHAPLDRFTVTYDQPNYVYVHENNVTATQRRSDEATEGSERFNRQSEIGNRQSATAGSSIPSVIATRRQDNGPPEIVEIVLDRPIPYNATTQFTFNDGTLEQTVELTFAPGDTDGDGDADLADFAAFQSCFGEPTTTGLCQSLDRDGDSVITDFDFAAFQALIIEP